MSDKAAIIEKLKAIKAKGNDKSVSFEEAALFAEGFARLLKKYNLTEAEVDSHETVEKIDQEIVYAKNGIAATWFRKLSRQTADLYFCSVYLFNEADHSKPSLTKEGIKFAIKQSYRFVGTKLNREVAASMFEFFVATAMRLSKDYSKVTTEQNDFRKGFCVSMSFRLAQMILDRDYQVPGNPNNLPAIVDRQSKEIALFVKQAGERAASRDVTIKADMTHANAGAEAAQGVFLGAQVGREENTLRLSKLYGKVE